MPHCRVMLVAALALALSACGGFKSPNDAVRRQNLELRRENEQLKAQAARRDAEIESLREQLGRADPSLKPRVEGAAIPRLTALKFDRYTGLIDSDGDGRHDRLRLYVRTLDQEGRFIPVSGRATAQAVLLRAGEGPLLLGKAEFDPAAVSDAYRTGLTGTHYTFEVSLTESPPPGTDHLAVHFTLTDAATGATSRLEEVLRTHPAKPG